MADLFDSLFEEDPPEASAPEAQRPKPAARSPKPDQKPERRILSVAQLNAQLRNTLETDFGEIWVEGEISGCKVWNSGHLFFKLKDGAAQVSAFMFRSTLRYLRFKPTDGQRVIARGKVTLYEAKGECQFVCEHMEPHGLGALQLAFDQLKTRLEEEGLFEAGRKRPLPSLPRKIGVVTSLDGAALRDIINVLTRRHRNAHVVIRPARVQGDSASVEIARGIKAVAHVPGVDVVIVGRGGGSIEDLWAFNEEIVARAIALCPVPVVSAVGHETDFTIADFVADVRASTPSAAAEIVVRTRQEFDRHVAQLRQKMSDQVRYLLLGRRHRLQELATHRGFRRLEELVRQYRQQADEFIARLAQALRGRLEQAGRRFTVAQTRIASFDLRGRIAALRVRLEQRSGELRSRIERFLVAKRQRLERLMLQLDERSPLRVLERGYAIVYDAAGNVVRAAEQVAIGDEVAVQLARGRLAAEVKRKQEEK